MKFDPFNRLSTDSIKILHEAFAIQHKGWTDQAYKDAYRAFCMAEKECVSGDKFDGLVNWWGNTKRHKTTQFRKRGGKWQMSPNKMMSGAHIYKKDQTPEAEDYDLQSMLDELHGKMMGSNLV